MFLINNLYNVFVKTTLVRILFCQEKTFEEYLRQFKKEHKPRVPLFFKIY